MLVESIRAFMRAHDIAPCTILAAVSGGYDSTALLIALADLRSDGFDVVAAHVNHHLRGDESDGDEQFVRELCANHGVALFVADGTLDANEARKHGVEAAAREVRTRLLQDIRESTNARYIATAHQKNDQAETVLMRIFSGSGLAGLRGIHAIRDDAIIRPLLGVTRADVQAFLRERNVTPRQDRMNDDPRYLRTRIRRTLRDYEPFVIDNLASVATQAQKLWPQLERELDRVEDAEITATSTTFRTLPDDPALRAALLHRHIYRLGSARDVSAEDLTRIATQIDAVKRISVTKDLEIVRREGCVVLRRTVSKAEAFEVTFDVLADEEIEFRISNFEFRMKKAHAPADADILHSSFEIRNSKFNLRQPFQLPENAARRFTLRSRRPGDRFHPLGQTHETKLKDFLINRKVPQEERDRLPLLVHENHIVWIPGVEISERYKVTPEGGEVWVATINYLPK